jgi:hypothetical protein
MRRSAQKNVRNGGEDSVSLPGNGELNLQNSTPQTIATADGIVPTISPTQSREEACKAMQHQVRDLIKNLKKSEDRFRDRPELYSKSLKNLKNWQRINRESKQTFE